LVPQAVCSLSLLRSPATHAGRRGRYLRLRRRPLRPAHAL